VNRSKGYKIIIQIQSVLDPFQHVVVVDDQLPCLEALQQRLLLEGELGLEVDVEGILKLLS
jgi:hypothetical protein